MAALVSLRLTTSDTAALPLFRRGSEPMSGVLQQRLSLLAALRDVSGIRDATLIGLAAGIVNDSKNDTGLGLARSDSIRLIRVRDGPTKPSLFSAVLQA
jgi:hypothetical protein